MFQVVPPCGGHPELIIDVLLLRHVSSRAPVWGASYGKSELAQNAHVSSRAPGWGASIVAFFFNRCQRFQVVPPCGGHLREIRRCWLCQRFQVVPPCGGHQVSAVHLTASFFVSSRAPVWGASGSEWYNFKFDCVSSRAPVWGASRFLPDCMISTWFQVVPPCGGHPQRLQELEAAGLVSSRAPVWGASKKPFLSRPIGVSFKSCPRVGGIR